MRTYVRGDCPESIHCQPLITKRTLMLMFTFFDICPIDPVVSPQLLLFLFALVLVL